MKELVMTEVEFCKQHCNDVSTSQEIWIQEYVAKNVFVGVGRPFGCRAYMPVVFLERGYFAIDSHGSLRPASTASIIKFGDIK